MDRPPHDVRPDHQGPVLAQVQQAGRPVSDNRPMGDVWKYGTQVTANPNYPGWRTKEPLLPGSDNWFVGRARQDGDEGRYATPVVEVAELEQIVPEEGPYPPRSWAITAIGLTHSAAKGALETAVGELRDRLRREGG
jgi:hypothetical protein